LASPDERPACSKVNYFPIYNLRATFASRLSASGAPDVFIAQMMGHTTPSILHTYAKAPDEYRREVIHKLEAFCHSQVLKEANPTEPNQGKVN
jgi:integrase